MKEPNVRVAYYQLTLGPAHMARIRTLDAVAGIECRGVELASTERTRHYTLGATDRRFVETVMEGLYEDLPLLTRLRAVRRHLDRTRPDVIIIDMPSDPLQFALGLLARRRGIRVFTRWAATVDDNPRSAWKEWLKGFVYRAFDGYLVTGSRALAYLESFAVPRSKATLCGNPVEAGLIESAREASSGERSETFLYVGRFLPYKNLDALIRGFSRYVREGGRWRLRLAGSGSDQEVERLRELAADTPAIEFIGHLQLDELVGHYTGDGALVLPSWEPWGLVVNEAMHAGMPILISELCGCRPELLVPGVNGFAFDPHDEDSMVEALFAMERLGAEERDAMARKGLEIIADHGVERWARSVASAVGVGVD